jgi:hypothetical protein
VLGIGGNLAAGGAGNEGGASEGGEGGAVDACLGVDLNTDPQNCGLCGRKCALGGVAFHTCEAGRCLIDECLPGRADSNMLNDDGCENACAETNGGVEICDEIDNNCDGRRDEGFDLNTVERCGGCNTRCELSHATAVCTEVGTEFRCRIDECEDGFHNADDLDSTGCEYDCDPTNNGVEVCDGLDNDCNGQFDEAAPNAGMPCDGPWFVTGSLGAGISRTTTLDGTAGGARQTLIGIDVLRAGVMAGRAFGVASPYLMARAFGGPVLWTLDAMDVQGTDTSKFQLGAGVSVSTASGLSLLLDVSALGERSASLGMAYRL